MSCCARRWDICALQRTVQTAADMWCCCYVVNPGCWLVQLGEQTKGGSVTTAVWSKPSCCKPSAAERGAGYWAERAGSAPL